jgi:hypothetical protein
VEVEPVVESYVTTTLRKTEMPEVDILVVVDDSVSMREEQENLRCRLTSAGCGVTYRKIVTQEGVMTKRWVPGVPVVCAVVATTVWTAGCEEDDGGEVAHVIVHNDFDNPEMSFNPPWTICRSSYMGVEFGKIPIGETSEEKEVEPGLDYVLMVLAWDDPECNPENCLPVASRNEEEVVSGQHRTIAINLPNHQGPCPPEGVQPIPEDLYDRILATWPEYEFEPYDRRTENTQCLE